MHLLSRQSEIAGTDMLPRKKLKLVETHDLMRAVHFTVVMFGCCFHSVEVPDLRRRDRISEIIRIDLTHISPAFRDIQLVHVILLALVEINRLFMKSG